MIEMMGWPLQSLPLSDEYNHLLEDREVDSPTFLSMISFRNTHRWTAINCFKPLMETIKTVI
jgi:hypothetical protein